MLENVDRGMDYTDSSQSGIKETADFDASFCFIHRVRIFYFKNAHRLSTTKTYQYNALTTKWGMKRGSCRVANSSSSKGEKYISSGPRIPNCTYKNTRISPSFHLQTVSVGNIPPPHAAAAPRTVRLPQRGWPLSIPKTAKGKRKKGGPRAHTDSLCEETGLPFGAGCNRQSTADS
jgi:hypothetical protein